MPPRPLPQSWSSPFPPTIAHYNGTLQWHHVHSTIAHYNGTLRRHPAMAPAPCNGTQAPRPLNHSTLQWHPAMAPRPLNHSTLQWYPAMAPSNGTTSTAPFNGILVPRPMRKSGSSPSPPIGSKNPYTNVLNKVGVIWMIIIIMKVLLILLYK